MTIWERFNNMSTTMFAAIVFCTVVGGMWGGVAVSYFMNPEGTVKAIQPEMDRIHKATDYVAGLFD